MRVGIVSAGAMGSAVGGALRDGGAEVVTTARGSERADGASRRGGRAQCLPDLDAVVAKADVVLSIAPPGEAEEIAGVIGAAAPHGAHGR